MSAYLQRVTSSLSNWPTELSLWNQHIILKEGRDGNFKKACTADFVARIMALCWFPVYILCFTCILFIFLIFHILFLVLALPFALCCLPCICKDERVKKEFKTLWLLWLKFTLFIIFCMPPVFVLAAFEAVYCMLNAFIAPELSLLIPYRYLTLARIQICMLLLDTETQHLDEETLIIDNDSLLPN